MKRKVYLETTIVSYLTARPSRDLLVAAHQTITLDWWTNHRGRFDTYISDFVLRESAKGDEFAARRRLLELSGIPVLDLDERAFELANTLIDRHLIPRKAIEDAFHIAIATVEGMDFVLTWNCRHIANAEILSRLRSLCRDFGYVLPTLCTPEQLMGD